MFIVGLKKDVFVTSVIEKNPDPSTALDLGRVLSGLEAGDTEGRDGLRAITEGLSVGRSAYEDGKIRESLHNAATYTTNSVDKLRAQFLLAVIGGDINLSEFKATVRQVAETIPYCTSEQQRSNAVFLSTLDWGKIFAEILA